MLPATIVDTNILTLPRVWIIVISAVCLLLGRDIFGEVDPQTQARLRMVEEQLKGRDITDAKVLRVMAKIPRHLFVPLELISKAYKDHPLPIGEGQTISQPYIVALMTQVLAIKSDEKVLEIGTGSGYQAAVLSELTGQVYSIEIRPHLAQEAQRRLTRLGHSNIELKQGDGYFGWPEAAPFDAIMITAATNHIPPPLLKQLKPGGRLVLPLGSTTFFQTLTLITKQADGTFDVQHLSTVSFVPMIGEVQK